MTSTFQIFVDGICGDDDYSGTLPVFDGKGNGPFKTLKKAVDSCRDIRTSGFSAPITVYLCTDIMLSSTLLIDRLNVNLTDGSIPISQVTFTSWGKRRKIAGGIEINEWKKDKLNGVSCYSAYVPNDTFFEDLFVNGKPAVRSRFPSDGSMLTALRTENDTCGWASLFNSSHWFIAHKEDLSQVPDIRNATVNFCHYWIDEHSPIQDYDEKSGKITMKLASRMQINTQYAKDGTPEDVGAFHYWLENVKSGFVHPGEWYLDVINHIVYYIPTENDEDSEHFSAWIPVIGTMILVEGTENNPIRGIHFNQIDFFCSKGEYVAKNIIEDKKVISEDVAGDAQSACNASGALEFRYAENCSVEKCSLSCLGPYAIRIGYGSHRIRIENDDISYISAGGVLIDGGDINEDPVTRTSDIDVTDCHISFLGRRYLAGCGILLKHASHCDLSYNEIHDLYYTGISVGWVWKYGKTVTNENRISHNLIYRVGGSLLSDMGGIYTLGEQQGTVIENNFIHHVSSSHYGGWGIYLDEGSSGMMIRNNVVFGTGSSPFFQHYGRDSCVFNNIFCAGEDGWFDLGKLNNLIFSGNVFIVQALPVPPKQFAPGFGIDFLLGNALLSTQDKEILGDAYPNNSIGTTSFVNPETDDITVLDDSVLDSIGFRHWNIKSVGPRQESK